MIVRHATPGWGPAGLAGANFTLWVAGERSVARLALAYGSQVVRWLSCMAAAAPLQSQHHSRKSTQHEVPIPVHYASQQQPGCFQSYVQDFPFSPH